MHETPLSDVSGKWVVAAVTRDYCDIWHVSESHHREVMHLHRPDEGVEHHRRILVLVDVRVVEHPIRMRWHP